MDTFPCSIHPLTSFGLVMLLILCSKRMASSVIFTNIYWAPKTMPCTMSSNTKSNQTGPYPDAANRVSRKETSKQTRHFSTVTANTEVGPGISETFGRWGRREPRNACWRRRRLLVYVVPTMCKRKRPGLCLPGTYYLAGKTRPDTNHITRQCALRCYLSAWDGTASGSLVMRANMQLFGLRFTPSTCYTMGVWIIVEGRLALEGSHGVITKKSLGLRIRGLLV